jgi:hypothetical protein
VKADDLRVRKAGQHLQVGLLPHSPSHKLPVAAAPGDVSSEYTRPGIHHQSSERTKCERTKCELHGIACRVSLRLSSFAVHGAGTGLPAERIP